MGGRRRARGRHRDVPARHVVRRAGLAGLAAAAATVFALTGSAPAQADAPVQTGWWNALSGGGQAAPAPTTPAGGLHIAVAPGQVLAFGAVLYAMPADATATLELPITNVVMTDNVNTTGETIGGVVPVPSLSPALALRACPTKTTAWKAGDDQPMAAAPGYDCSTRSVTGNLAADGKTVTFLLDGSLETTPGQLSVAIVPVLTNAIPNLGTEAPVDTTQPFSLDVPKPGTDSLTLTGTSPGLAGGTPAGGAAGGSTGGPAAGGASPVAVAGGGTAPPPLPSGSATGALPGVGAGAAPPVVASSAPATAPSAAPAAAATPATDNTAHDVALAMLILLGVLIIATSGNQLPRTPRLLGGAARAAAVPPQPGQAVGAAAAATATAGAGAGAAAAYGQRGLGRFAKQRTDPPRPLI